MVNNDDVAKENINKNILNWPQIPDCLCRILIIEGSGSRKNPSSNLINNKVLMIITLLIIFIYMLNEAK